MYKLNEVSGVYGLYKNGELVYIGESINIHARAMQHKKDKDFDSYNMLVEESNIIKRKGLEMYMIADKQPLYIGFFHTGAYQEALSGYGGTQHCLVPAPKHVLIDKDEDGKLTTKLFAKEQSYKSMLKILGY